jgi:hypothetical protein
MTTPHIDTLDLTAEEMTALRRQGFVSQERRHGRMFFKLRFRMPTGKQCVRYLGTDPAVAEEVQQELFEMQMVRRMNRELAKLVRKAGQKLQSSKETLGPALAKAGYHFHGLSVRRKRVVK